MVTDVVVILLFTAAAELAHELLTPPTPAAASAFRSGGDRNALGVGPAWRFFASVGLQISLSLLHAAVLSLLALPIVRLARAGSTTATTPRPTAATTATEDGTSLAAAPLASPRSSTSPPSPRMTRWTLATPPTLADLGRLLLRLCLRAALLCPGAYAFRGEAGLQALAAWFDGAYLDGYSVDAACLRLAPMLGARCTHSRACPPLPLSARNCVQANAPSHPRPHRSPLFGSVHDCNPLGRRREMTALLHHTLPPLLALFFCSTGSTMRVHQLMKTWLTALTLFSARLIAIWAGTYVSIALCLRGGGAISSGGSLDWRCLRISVEQLQQQQPGKM